VDLDRADLNPWRVARRIFESPDRASGPTYWLSWIRSVVGALVLVIMTIPYRGPVTVLGDVWTRATSAAVPCLVAVVITVPAVYGMNDPAGRQAMRRGMPGLLTGVGGLVSLFAFAFLMGPVGKFIMSDFGFGHLLLALLWIVVLLWFIVFALVGSVLAARSVVRVGDVHPLLAPVCATAACWYLLVADMVAFDTHGVPPSLWLALGVGGVLTTTVVAGIEIHVLRSCGVRLRGADDRGRLPEAERSRLQRRSAVLVISALAVAGISAVVLLHLALGGGVGTFVALLVMASIGAGILWRHGVGSELVDLLHGRR
jgi:hypothetical protein